MNITIAAPTKVNHYRPRYDWAPLLTAFAQAEVGTGLSVPLADLPVGPRKRTQGTLHGIARRRGMRIHTRVENETLFILLTEKSTEVTREK